MLVNPVQSFHPNAPPPNDAVLLTSSVRKAEDSTERYARWLIQLRELCTACDMPLIFDEVYTGFRLAPAGRSSTSAFRPTWSCTGKRWPAVCRSASSAARKPLMRRFDPEHPMRMAYVVGTFSAHPAVMGAMSEFLRWVVEPAVATQYDEMNQRCAGWVRSTNQRLAEASLPVRVMNLGTIWTVLFKEPEPLQLAAPVLPPRRGRDVELGRHGKVPVQHGLHRRRLRGLAGEAVRRGKQDEDRWMVVDAQRAPGKGQPDANASHEGSDRQPGAPPEASRDLLRGGDAA